MAKKKGKGGARGKYAAWITEEGLVLLEGWARDGLTNEQIAQQIGINPDTLYTWIKRFPEISEALKKGKAVVDNMVENALLKRALGYEVAEVTEGPLETAEGIKYEEIKRVTKHVPGDVTAQIFWLKNRRPDRWRDKQDVEHSGHMTATTAMTNLSEEELRNLANIDAGDEAGGRPAGAE